MPKEGKRKGQLCTQWLKECLVQGRAHSGPHTAPGSSCGTPRAASQMKCQVSWTSEVLSRQLEPDFLHADRTAAVNGANREGHPWHYTNGQAQANGETKGTTHVKSHSRVLAAQHQQPSKQAGEHVLLCLRRLWD